MKYLRHLFLILSICTTPIYLISQNSPNITDLERYTSISKFLKYYDNIAWLTTDSITNKGPEARNGLGRHWFIYFDEQSNPHCVYGKFENNVYNSKYHFTLNDKEQIIETKENVSQEICIKYSKALDYAHSFYANRLTNPQINYNQYVYLDSLNNVVVNIFPAFQSDFTAPFGYEVYMVFDNTGDNLLYDYSYFSEKGLRFYDLNKQKQLVIDYSESDKLHLGAVFYAFYYTTFNLDVTLITKDYRLKLVFPDPKNYKDFYWISVPTNSLYQDVKHSKKNKNK